MISYNSEAALTVDDFRTVLISSTLSDRRPINDISRLEAMLRNASIIITARDVSKIVGVSRAITDYSYCCYLSDLAVDTHYQSRGIGQELIARTHSVAGNSTKLYVVSSPSAETFYPHIGMTHVSSCWKFNPVDNQ